MRSLKPLNMTSLTFTSVGLTVCFFIFKESLYKSTNHTWLKGRTGMLPWHAIPFLKGLGMLTPNPCQNGWPRLWRSCNSQKNTQLYHSMAPKEPYMQSEWADVSPLLKYISGASPKSPEGAVLGEYWIKCGLSTRTLKFFLWKDNW